MGATKRAIHILGASNEVSASVIRGNAGSGGIVRNDAFSANLRFSVVAGNSGGDSQPEAVRDHLDGQLTMVGCVVEANNPLQLSRVGLVRNSVFGNVFVGISGNPSPGLGGNITSNTTNSVMRLLNIAPASQGVGTNLVWAGVAAYIPRIGSLAQGAGVGYAGIDAAKSGDGGPALLPIGAKFLGRDSSTNLNHGAPIGGVSYSTNSPFSGGGSAAFDGASGAIDLGSTIGAKLVGATNITLESWVLISAYMANGPAINVNVTNAASAGVYIGSYQGKLSFIGRSSPADSAQIVSLDAGGPTNAWTHFAATVDIPGDKVVLYVNGAASKTGAVSFGKTSYSGAAVSLSAGIGWNGTTSFWNGKISDARIWNVARTPEEIAANYTNRLTGTEAGLVGYWRLDERDTPISAGPFNLRNPTLQPTFMEAF